MLLLARMVKTLASIVAGVIVVGILLHVFGANSHNEIVRFVYDLDRPLVSPFQSIFNLDSEKLQIALNWGIAAAVYAVVGTLIAHMLAGAALTGYRRRPVV
ncbi:MAG TPA: hypothetical protein VGJ32_06965 [Solirubrobacteraceae bacterium]|jgi:uncharacterized protein YggT (Ycf19 family)